MKKYKGFLLLVLCLILSMPLALASDYPFQEGVDYYKQFRTWGANPTILNFGYAKLAPYEDLYAAKKTTVRKATTEKIESLLDADNMFYIYAKWQYARRVEEAFTIDAMLVMTDPQGRYYATYGQWEQEVMRSGKVCSWFFDATDMLRRCREESEGKLPKGEYAFSLFFNNKSFRVNKVTLK